MSLFSFLKKKNEPIANFISVDIHSHLLPGIDDGAETLEDSILLIKELSALGFKKLITTPHVMGDFYKNTPDGIREKLSLVKNRLVEEGIDFQLEAAAEYYLDESLISKLEKNEELLTFGDKYLLFETSFLNEPAQLKEAIFIMNSQGYKPVLAHPERYVYFYNKFSEYQDLVDRGVLLQLNLNSLCGYYSRASQKIAGELIKNKMISFVGTDCHGTRHIDALKRVFLEKKFQELSELNLHNNSLL